MYQHFFKRLFDIIISAMVLIVLSPVILITALLLLILNEGAGVFFYQERPGKGGHIFKIIKFKTMNERKDSSGKLLPDKQRITRFGSFVRNASLDELPQLWNVLKGDMSLIGPRPLLKEYLPLYTPEQARRHDVLPGITGWAQCHGRNNLSWTDKFKLDVWYVDNISLKTDISIIWATVLNIIRKKDINNNDSVQFTTELFNGHN